MTSKLQLSGALRLLFRLPAILYRWRCGWLLGRRFLLLIHVGRRTGKLRRTVLEVIEYRQDIPEAIVISAFGPRSDWLLNMQMQAQIGDRHRIAAIYRDLPVSWRGGSSRGDPEVSAPSSPSGTAHPLCLRQVRRLALRRYPSARSTTGEATTR